MNDSVNSGSTKRLRFDSLTIEKRLETAVRKANVRLDQLVSEDFFRHFCEPFANPCAKPNPDNDSSRRKSVEQVSFQLRFGRTRLRLQELSYLGTDTIVPLLESTKGQIQIWSNGRLFGRGVLLVADGKLAVKIESIESKTA